MAERGPRELVMALRTRRASERRCARAAGRPAGRGAGTVRTVTPAGWQAEALALTPQGHRRAALPRSSVDVIPEAYRPTLGRAGHASPRDS